MFESGDSDVVEDIDIVVQDQAPEMGCYRDRPGVDRRV
jgi:hypothetical protein